MKPLIKIFLYSDDGKKVFGPGPYELLCDIEQTGSLRAAASQMGLGYSKALHMIKNSEQVLGYPLTQSVIGGANGGSSTLTPQAKVLMEQYRKYITACYSDSEKRFTEIFEDTHADE